MALRLVELSLGSARIAEVPALVADRDPLDVWTAELGGGRAVARILVRADEAEGISDLLSARFEGEEGFRLIVLAVEASLPPPPTDETRPEPGTGEARGESAGSGRISREELYQDLTEAAAISPVYLVTVLLSTLVAAIGLIRGDVAIIIGAMVIAPLLGPNVALSLAATLGDLPLAWRSLRAFGAATAAALALSVALGLVFTVDPGWTELASRTRAGLGDIALALAAGSAGTLAYTTGLPAAVIGVMVAVALLPPLVATGLLAGSGHPGAALGAGLLFLTNVTCVNLAGVATFLAQRVRPRLWWEAERARRATRIAIAIWLGTLALLALLILLVEDPSPGR